MRKVIFFDRDGIVNVPPEPGGYVQCPDDFHIMPEFFRALEIIRRGGYEAVIITNQQGVGKGLYSKQTLRRIHEKLLDEVHGNGMEILDIFFCPHLATENCNCRKPRPGMILEAARKWNIDLAESWMVGDSFRDVDAGSAAGCRTLLINPEYYAKSTVWIQSISDMPDTVRDEIVRGM